MDKKNTWIIIIVAIVAIVIGFFVARIFGIQPFTPQYPKYHQYQRAYPDMRPPQKINPGDFPPPPQPIPKPRPPKPEPDPYHGDPEPWQPQEFEQEYQQGY